MVKRLLLMTGLLVATLVHAECRQDRVRLQVLGAGGPELTDGRASTSYLIWLDGKARVLLDAGSGSALNFEHSGAKLNDLTFVLFSHLHVDHSVDFPAFIKAFYFSGRNRDLHVYGPKGNRMMPSTRQFVQGLFGTQGVYRYLSEYIDEAQRSNYKIRTHDVPISEKTIQTISHDDSMHLSAVPVYHGPIPALAWRVELADCVLSFSGDMNNDYDTLSRLAVSSDILVAHNAIPESQTGAGRRLHMPPSEIGKIAAQAKVKKLILSHRMSRTLGKEVEAQTLQAIRRHYSGKVDFADDMCVIFGKH